MQTTFGRWAFYLFWGAAWCGWLVFCAVRDPESRSYGTLFVFFFGVPSVWNMLPRARPKTEAARKAEIIRLENKRDAMLEEAPRRFWFQRLISLVAVVGYPLAARKALIRSHDFYPLALVIVVVFGLFLTREMYRLWMRPPPRDDKWAMADRVVYHGDSPRDVQRKIDELRSGIRQLRRRAPGGP